jgi:hypothetical protein
MWPDKIDQAFNKTGIEGLSSNLELCVGGTQQLQKCGSGSLTLSPELSTPGKPWRHDSSMHLGNQTPGRPPLGLYGGSRSSALSPRQNPSPYRPPPPPPGAPGPLRSPMWRSPFGIGSLGTGGFPSPVSRAPSPCHVIHEVFPSWTVSADKSSHYQSHEGSQSTGKFDAYYPLVSKTYPHSQYMFGICCEAS